MNTLRGAVVALVLAAVGLVGCTGEPGQAVPTAPSAPPSVTGVPGLPPRPVAVSVAKVDPCGLLTAEQRVQYGLDSEPSTGTQPSEDNAPMCGYFNNDAGGGLGVSFVPSTVNGIGVWLDGSRGGTVTPVMVAGFPAVEIRDESLDPPYCAVAVDVADGQHLLVANSPSVTNPASTDEQCAAAAMYAEAAMQTLVAR